MTHSDDTSPLPFLSQLDRRPWLWLLLGGLLLAASHMRFGVGALAWIAPLPWLRYLRVTRGWRSRLALVGAAMLAWTLAVLKIITAPLPAILAPAFGVPIALLTSVAYLAVPSLRRRGETVAALGFAALTVCGEWALHGLLPLGTWGAVGNTQLEHLALMQLASVTGLHGVSFLVMLVAAALESALASPTRRRLVGITAAAALVLGVTAAGQARLVASTATGEAQTRIAAVGTDSHVGRGPMPSPEEVEVVHRGLYARTRAAARSGAQVVVWTEAATMVERDDEAAFLDEVETVAREENVHVVVGYVIPITREPLRYYNRYAFVTPDGVHHVYDKHEPVPGEPAVRGTAPMPLFESAALGRISGAICYDYDFPRLGLRHAALDVDLVVLPSSDWRGIDPIHTRMASVRAIEGGHALVRSTRFGLSAGYDAHGRERGRLSAFDEGERVLVMSLPRHGVTTVYGTLGDWFPLLCLVFAGLVIGATVARRLGYGDPRWTRSSASRAARSSKPSKPSGRTVTSS